jgi:hypothetical protein
LFQHNFWEDVHHCGILGKRGKSYLPFSVSIRYLLLLCDSRSLLTQSDPIKTIPNYFITQLKCLSDRQALGFSHYGGKSAHIHIRWNSITQVPIILVINIHGGALGGLQLWLRLGKKRCLRVLELKNSDYKFHLECIPLSADIIIWMVFSKQCFNFKNSGARLTIFLESWYLESSFCSSVLKTFCVNKDSKNIKQATWQ